jgi:hypothetical protein
MTTRAWSRTCRGALAAASILSSSGVAWAQYGSPAPGGSSGAGATSAPTIDTTTTGRSGAEDCGPNARMSDACRRGGDVGQRDWIQNRSGASSSTRWDKDPKVRLPQTDQ